MPRSLLITLAAFFIGSFVGWQLHDATDDVPDGIQWEFNEAARSGNVNRMKKLISEGADPFATPSYAQGAVSGFTPLLIASAAGESEAVEFLIKNGADVNQTMATSRPMGVAMGRLRKAEATVRILKEHGAWE